MLTVCRRRPFVFELGDLWPASIVAFGAMKRSLPLRRVEKLELFLYRRSAAVAALTQAFKRNLAKVEVVSSNLITRSNFAFYSFFLRERCRGLTPLP